MGNGYRCPICKEIYYYQDEMIFYNINGDEVSPSEHTTANPDHLAYQVCRSYDETMGGFSGIQQKLD